MPSSLQQERRKGDSVAFAAALISAAVIASASWYLILKNDPRGLGWFAFHPTSNSLAIASFVYAILTLQPTAHASTKEEGLVRHQRAVLGLALPAVLFGTSAVSYNKSLHQAPSLTSWHGIFGALSVSWIIFQVALGGASVWFGGAALGRNKARRVWKYHRLSGYLLLPMLLLTAHMGGAWSDYASRNSTYLFRLVAYGIAPFVLLISVFSRVRVTKLGFV